MEYYKIVTYKLLLQYQGMSENNKLAIIFSVCPKKKGCWLCHVMAAHLSRPICLLFFRSMYIHNTQQNIYIHNGTFHKGNFEIVIYQLFWVLPSIILFNSFSHSSFHQPATVTTRNYSHCKIHSPFACDFFLQFWSSFSPQCYSFTHSLSGYFTSSSQIFWLTNNLY